MNIVTIPSHLKRDATLHCKNINGVK